MVDDENTTTSPFAILTYLKLSSAIFERADKGSPCVPVTIITFLLSGKFDISVIG